MDERKTRTEPHPHGGHPRHQPKMRAEDCGVCAVAMALDLPYGDVDAAWRKRGGILPSGAWRWLNKQHMPGLLRDLAPDLAPWRLTRPPGFSRDSRVPGPRFGEIDFGPVGDCLVMLHDGILDNTKPCHWVAVVRGGVWDPTGEAAPVEPASTEWAHRIVYWIVRPRGGSLPFRGDEPAPLKMVPDPPAEFAGFPVTFVRGR